MLLGIDIGTTNSKVGLFGLRGETLSLASRETETLRHRDGFDYYDPEKMWKSIADGIREVLAGPESA